MASLLPSFVQKWWRRRYPVAVPHLRFVVYTRSGCSCCEKAWRLLETERARWGFALEAVDVDTRAELAAEHGESVPVVEVNGKVRFRGVVNPVLLERLLRAEGSKASGIE